MFNVVWFSLMLKLSHVNTNCYCEHDHSVDAMWEVGIVVLLCFPNNMVLIYN